jgi:Curli production assembly/transport component CsgG/Cysteine rich repeat
MLKSLSPLFLAMLCSLLSPLAAWPQGAPPKPADSRELVAVLDLDGVGTNKAQISAVSDELRARLLNSGKFRLVNRDQTNAILNEQAFQQEACTSEDCAVKAGKLLGVKHLVTGRITHLDEGLWQVAAQIVDVESAETLKAVTVVQHGGFEKVLSEAVPGVAAQLTEAASTAANNAKVCSADVQRLCKDVQKGKGRIIQCLKDHRQDLSPDCREELSEKREKQQRAAADCKADMQRLCKDVRPGGGRLFACLKEHTGDLSPACRADLPAN